MDANWILLAGRGVRKQQTLSPIEENIERWARNQILETKRRCVEGFDALIAKHLWLCWVFAFVVAALPVVVLYAAVVTGFVFWKISVDGRIGLDDIGFYVALACIFSFFVRRRFVGKRSVLVERARDERSRRILLGFRLKHFDQDFKTHFPPPN